MSRREQLADDAAEVAALLEHQDDEQPVEDVEEPEPTPARTSVRAAATLVHHDAGDLAAMLALDDAMTAGAALCQAYDGREQAAGRLAEHVLSYAVPAPLVQAFAEQDARPGAALPDIVVCGPDDVDERGGASDQDPPIRVVYDGGAQPCEVCGLNVTAQKIAETGRTRHPWHPED